MGGQIFAGGPDPLYTPRMPPAVYQHVKAACHAKLQRVFEHVATPIEGPEKADFGDIDFLVYSRDADVQGTDWQDVVYAALGAERRFSQQKPACAFAIPWPTEALPESGDVEDVQQELVGPALGRDQYIQVDVHVCEGLDTFRWSVFKQDHGDLWNLLGSTIRPYGLTIDHEALYVRIAEIEKLDKKKAKVFLTSDPKTVLQFLGLDPERWKQPFATMQDTYEYTATSRFFWVKPDSADDGPGGSDDEQRIGGEFTRKNLKSNDRQRMDKRPMFSRWINEFIPTCREQRRYAERTMDRDGALEDTFKQFGVRETHDARILEFRKKRQAEALWKEVIKPAVPTEGIEPMFRGCATNGLKKIIMQDDESFGVVPDEPLRDKDGLFDEDAVRRFVKAHWKEVGGIGFQRNHERFLEKKAKQNKEEATPNRVTEKEAREK
ncbi:uncharacterized protein PG998_013259 [Apiospora kogelbergensis]|uniref:uncharacterized protein n=1 Tax=Apiospora kogelbergensis TaxID=1337665 RepID=UPI00312F0685